MLHCCELLKESDQRSKENLSSLNVYNGKSGRIELNRTYDDVLEIKYELLEEVPAVERTREVSSKDEVDETISYYNTLEEIV